MRILLLLVLSSLAATAVQAQALHHHPRDDDPQVTTRILFCSTLRAQCSAPGKQLPLECSQAAPHRPHGQP